MCKEKLTYLKSLRGCSTIQVVTDNYDELEIMMEKLPNSISCDIADLHELQNILDVDFIIVKGIEKSLFENSKRALDEVKTLKSKMCKLGTMILLPTDLTYFLFNENLESVVDVKATLVQEDIDKSIEFIFHS